jgi:hypothetical protein
LNVKIPLLAFPARATAGGNPVPITIGFFGTRTALRSSETAPVKRGVTRASKSALVFGGRRQE